MTTTNLLSSGRLAILVAFTSLADFAIAAKPSIHFESSSKGEEARVVVTDLPPSVFEELAARPASDKARQEILQVYTLLDGEPSMNPMLGDCTISDKTLVFSPRYPLRPGMTYRAVFDPQSDSALTSAGLVRVEHEFQIPSAPSTGAAKLTAIFPSQDVLPENLLKFYLHFSTPMSRGEAYRRIRLLDENGKRVESPFLELSEELWSPDGRRFTLYFDPGRIKRGLKPRELFGPALSEGGTYTLTVDSKWPDANGEPLAAAGAKKFRVVAPDDKQPDPKRWKIQPPPSGSRDALVIEFDEPLDSAMLERVLTVQDADQNLIRGAIRIGKYEQRWLFEPSETWKPGTYKLVSATTLEDLAGNSIGRPFEVDVFRPARPPSDADLVSLPFEIRER